MAGLTHALEAIIRRSDDLFAVELDGIEIVFRLPSIKQAEQYQMLLSLATDNSMIVVIYEHIFRNIVVDQILANEDPDLPAGVPETISRLALFLSGVDEPSTEYTEELFKAHRERLGDTTQYMNRVVCQVFGGYTFESLDKLNYQKLTTIFIQAEQVLIDRGIIEQIHTFKTPEEAKPKPFTVEDAIRQDTKDFKDFDRPEVDDPRTMAKLRRVREEAIRRAKEEELKFKRRLR
jgi:hypothetical protein